MLMKTKLLAIFIVLFFLMGCATLGLKNKESCNQIIVNGPSGPESRFATTGEKIVCYREAAVAIAYAAGGANAEKTCDEIKSWSADQDYGYLARSYANFCYNDVAIITAKKENAEFSRRLCDKIEPQTIFTGITSGGSVTKQICERKVEAKIKSDPEDYLSRPNNICSLIFIAPFTLLLLCIHKL
ncbi:MAG: hypothetical protein ABII22_07190 [Candidatus Micrarchaeota archaeon]